MEWEDKQILKICAIGSALLLTASGVMWLRDGPPAGPELRAVVHAVCPAGGQPHPDADAGSDLGVLISSELIKSEGFMKRAVFCTALMWK